MAYPLCTRRVFCRACPREFLDQLLLHVVQLDDDASEHGAERLPGFFRDLCALCHGLVRLAPRLACDRLEPLLKKAALELTLLPHFDGKEVRSTYLMSLEHSSLPVVCMHSGMGKWRDVCV